MARVRFPEILAVRVSTATRRDINARAARRGEDSSEVVRRLLDLGAKAEDAASAPAPEPEA